MLSVSPPVIPSIFPHIVEASGSTRLELYPDSRIPSIGIKADAERSIADALKLSTGYLRRAEALDDSRHQRDVLISMKSFEKYTGLCGVDMDHLLESPEGFTRLSQVAAIVIRNIEGLPDAAAATLFRQTLRTNAKELFHPEAILTREDTRLAIAKDRVHFLCIERLLGEGEASEAWLARDLLKPSQPLVFKCVKIAMFPVQLEGVFKLMQTLNPDGHVTGIQVPHHKIVELSGTGKKRIGFLTTRYSGNLKDFQFNSPAQLKTAFCQILSGMNYLHQGQYFHRDIKPGNVLFQESPERFDIADLDDTSHLKEITRILSAHQKNTYSSCSITRDTLWGVATDFFTCGSDEDALGNLVGQFDRRELSLKEASYKILKLLQARDLFALGLSFQELARGSQPEGTPLKLSFSQRLVNLGLDESEATAFSLAVDKMLTREDRSERVRGFDEIKALMEH